MATESPAVFSHAHNARQRGTPVPEPGARIVVAYVRKLQRHQSHEPCFMTDARYGCMEFGCRWRKDCMRLVAESCR